MNPTPAPDQRSRKIASMDNEARHAAVAALIRLAESPDYRDRADSGRSLASFAEIPEASRSLLKLTLDADDTFVTLETATALLRRQDSTGLALVASALAGADPSHADWIDTAVLDVFGIFASERDAALQVCETLTRSADERASRGATLLIAFLAEISPVLYSAPKAGPDD